MKEVIQVDSIFGIIKTFKNDIITDQIIKFGNHTRPEFAFATSIISNNFNIFDLGAHIGTFTLTAVKKLSKNSKILTVEASLENFKLLNENTKNYANIINLNNFLGNENENYEFIKGSENNSGSGSLVKSADKKNITHSIDSLVEKFFKPHYIKIDIEGLEGQLIENSNFIKKHMPILYIEINDKALTKNGSSSKKLLGLLNNYGYSFFRNVGYRNLNNDLFLPCFMENLNNFSLSNIFDVLCISKESTIFEYLLKSSIKINYK
ncbi:FkbM family methyltransferase [Pelagibacteraceae bacterium]|nr:FkbM family methyltransferase [Pelagibacteraceae bacterium]